MQPANTIVGRVAEAISVYPPFDSLKAEDLHRLAASITISFVEKEKTLFKVDDPPADYFYFLKEGCVNLFDREQQLVDQCDDGEIFGVRSMLTGNPYKLSAKTVSECLLYTIPNQIFKPFLAQYPSISLYFAEGLASGLTLSGKDKDRPTNTVEVGTRAINDAFNLNETIQARPHQEVIKGSVTTLIREAAERMTKHRVGSLIITNEQNHPVGILTDTDLRKHVATGRISIDKPVTQIMSAPVVTVPNGQPVYEVVLQMMEKKVHHLCITADGTDKSEVLGVVSERDILVVHSNDPAVLLKEIRYAAGVEGLPALRDKAEKLINQYLEHEVAISYVSKVISAINDAIINKAVETAIRLMEEQGKAKPASPFCWLSLGSEGREEQLLRTDQDNALIYQLANGEKDNEVQAYYLEMARLVTDTLMDCGFEKCPADMMAINPKWCRSTDQWLAYFKSWILTPEPKAIMLSTIFFDYRHVAGQVRLKEELDEALKRMISEEKIFLNYLAKNATLNPAPLGFFKNFIVERSGEHKDEFDIKLRAMMPLVDAARVLSLNYEILDKKNTIERFNAIASMDSKNADLYADAASAYEICMRMRVLHGLANGNSGRYINLERLKKLDRQRLKTAFEPISDLQKLLEVKFQLSYFNT